jgi:hypothetical protein
MNLCIPIRMQKAAEVDGLVKSLCDLIIVTDINQPLQMTRPPH